jgi:GNAT superfamily N-acetyltransferase
VIRRADDDAALARYVELRERVDPLTASTVEDMHAFLVQTESPLVLVADGGFGSVMRFPPESDADLKLGVVREARGRGLGSELLERLLAHARSQGWASVLVATDEEGRAWAERRGFELVDREERVVLELRNVASETVSEGPPGIELTDLAARPELEPEVHALMLAGVEDVPGELARIELPDLETWRAWLRAPSRLPEFLVIALDGGQPVGYAALNVYPRVGYHAFTTVARTHRGRGIARALKRELIHRARGRGLDRLITQSNVDNVPMRTLNAELGFKPASPLLYLRKRLAL